MGGGEVNFSDIFYKQCKKKSVFFGGGGGRGSRVSEFSLQSIQI